LTIAQLEVELPQKPKDETGFLLTKSKTTGMDTDRLIDRQIDTDRLIDTNRLTE